MFTLLEGSIGHYIHAQLSIGTICRIAVCSQSSRSESCALTSHFVGFNANQVEEGKI